MPPPAFVRVQTQFIAALGDPSAISGVNAAQWGLWRVDPGPRGVPLRDTARLEAAGWRAPAGWTLSPSSFWLEEHGLLMEAPEFPLPPGRYLVTGDREKTVPLAVHADGQWQLEGATLHEVTHLPCRAARYDAGSPARAPLAAFPVAPGGPMPAVPGCVHQDYAVIFVVAVEQQQR